MCGPATVSCLFRDRGTARLDVKIALDGNRAAAAQIGMATEIARAMALIPAIDRGVEFRWQDLRSQPDVAPQPDGRGALMKSVRVTRRCARLLQTEPLLEHVGRLAPRMWRHIEHGLHRVVVRDAQDIEQHPPIVPVVLRLLHRVFQYIVDQVLRDRDRSIPVGDDEVARPHVSSTDFHRRVRTAELHPALYIGWTTQRCQTGIAF